jgi:predicted CXXCH cytochrome family protein
MRKENRRSFKTVLLMPRVQFKFVGIVAILAGTLPAFSLAQMEQLQIQLKRIPQASCLTSKCHPDIDKARVVHGPVQAKGCTVCHIPASEPGLVKGKKEVLAKLPKDHPPLFKIDILHIESTCFLCHDDFGDLLKKAPSIHSAIKKKGCPSCHNPHAGNNKSLLSSAKIDDGCIECHKMGENVKTAHEPVVKGECTKCHGIHSSNHRQLLIKTEKQLCFSCHEDTKAELDKFKYIHKPVVDRQCSECHAPHGSDYFRLLIEKYTPEFYAPFNISNYNLCFSCHRKDIVLVKETEKLTEFRNGKTNLHYRHVNMPDRGRTCRACHATHASDEPKHIREKFPFGSMKIPIQYEKTETGGSCLGCHDRRGYDRVNPVVYFSDKDKAASTSRRGSTCSGDDHGKDGG